MEEINPKMLRAIEEKALRESTTNNFHLNGQTLEYQP